VEVLMQRFSTLCALMTVLALSLPLAAATFEFRTLENPPLEFTRDGKIVGIAVDLVREAVKRTGHDANIEIRPWKRVLRETATGLADGAFNAGRSEAREQWGMYPDEKLIDETYVLFSHRPIALPESFEGIEQLRLGDQLGYYYGETFHKAVLDQRFKSVETAHTIEKNIEKLMAQRIDVFIGDLLPTRYYIDAMGLNDEIQPVSNASEDAMLVISTSSTYLAFSRKSVNPAYVEKFSVALRSMKEDGTYARIIRSYVAPYAQ
jgi:polar amino acid transport system substrate-binding protein